MFLLDKMKYLLLFIFLVSCSNKESAPNYSLSNNGPIWEQTSYNTLIQDQKDLQKLVYNSQIPMSILKRYNNISSFKDGQRIKVPATKYYYVKNGETALGIALKHGMTFSEFTDINALHHPYKLRYNQQIKIIEAKLKEAHKLSNDNWQTTKLFWPMKGKVTRKFGKQKDKKRYYNIAISSTNSEVRSVANGKVMYVGKDLQHNAQLIIIGHRNNLFSSYSNLGEVIVGKDEEVKAKQIIGEADNSLLYFAMRKGSIAIDPLKLLSK
jgi:murein DD-endopeptidase MepM/ murein hydrolase activator NlpD